jgi:hypothetical protein
MLKLGRGWWGQNSLIFILTSVICFAFMADVNGAEPPRIAYLISSQYPNEVPAEGDILSEVHPEFGRDWLVKTIHETYEQTGGKVTLDFDYPSSSDTGVYYYTNRVMFYGEVIDPPHEPPDTVIMEIVNAPYPWNFVVDPGNIMHEIFGISTCWEFPHFTWIDEGDGIFGEGDTLTVFNDEPDPPLTKTLAILDVKTGWFIASAEAVPTLTELGILICAILLIGLTTWILLRRRGQSQMRK